MKQSLSKDNLTGMAQQAMNSLKRLVTSSFDNLSILQQDLLTTSKQIEEAWQKRREQPIAAVQTLWCERLQKELALQVQCLEQGVEEGEPLAAATDEDGNGDTGGEKADVNRSGTSQNQSVCSPQKPLPEPSLLIVLSAARVMGLALPPGPLPAIFSEYSIIACLIRLYMRCEISKRIRDACEQTLVLYMSLHPSVMEEVYTYSVPFLFEKNDEEVLGRVDSHANKTGENDVSEAERADTTKTDVLTRIAVDPLTVCLLSLLVNGQHLSERLSAQEASSAGVTQPNKDNDATTDADPPSPLTKNASGDVSSFTAMKRHLAVRVLKSTHALSQDLSSPGGETSAAVTTDSSEKKPEPPAYLTASLLVTATAFIAGLLRADTGGKRTLLALHSLEWSSLWTSATNSLQNMPLNITVSEAVGGRRETTVALGTQQLWCSELIEAALESCTSGCFTDCRVRAAGGAGYTPTPVHWVNTLLTGSEELWRLVSRTSSCVLFPQAPAFLQVCLASVGVDCAPAEGVFRGVIFGLTVLSTANPHNARVLGDANVCGCLLSIITNEQSSVFPAEVRVSLHKGSSDSDVAVCVTPASILNANTTQLVVGLMSSMTSVHLPSLLIDQLQEFIASMVGHPPCPTDVGVIESLLHVAGTYQMQPNMLFLPGDAGAVCEATRFTGRWNGYSFSAWVNPICVWPAGCVLFSIAEDSGTSVSLLLVAAGRSCCLALRSDPGVAKEEKPTTLVLQECVVPVESWTHIVFSHGLSGYSVYVNGRKLFTAFNITFPKEPTKKHPLTISLGCGTDAATEASPTAASSTSRGRSFFGFVLSMDLIEEVLSEKDIQRTYSLGPAASAASVCDERVLLSLISSRRPGGAAGAASEPRDPNRKGEKESAAATARLTGSLTSSGSGAAVHVSDRIVCFSAPNTLRMFEEKGMMEWALRTLSACWSDCASSPSVALLCLSFIATVLRTTRSEAELNRVLKGDVMERLRRELQHLSQPLPGLASVLFTAATAYHTPKLLRPHPSTQVVIEILLEQLESIGAATAAACGGKSDSSDVANIILREISEYLVTTHNLEIFEQVEGRLERVLRLSLTLPVECAESVVIFLEKVCKRQIPLEVLFRFLLSSRSLDGGVEVLKLEIVRMLFDVARGNPAVADLICGCFKGQGIAALIALVDGVNHRTESIRVLAMRLISLLLHGNKRQREAFTKMDGFGVLALCITSPVVGPAIPIRTPTFDCLFQMGFDAYQPVDKMEEVASRLPATTFISKLKKKYLDGNSSNGGSSPTSAETTEITGVLEMQGYLPSLMSQRLRFSRRQYSFELTRDFAQSDKHLLTDEGYSSKDGSQTLVFPLAFEAAFEVLRHVVRLAAAENPCETNSPAQHQDLATEEDTMQSPGEHSVTTVTGDEDENEETVLKVLVYLEKVFDFPKNVEAVLPYAWVDWLWGAVADVLATEHNGGAAAASPTTEKKDSSLPRFSRKFVSAVATHTRALLRKLAMIDLHHAKPLSVRRIKTLQQPPLLLRMFVEEVTRHFAVRRDNYLHDPEDARNVIKNLDLLFYGIEDDLTPFPSSLGVEIVSTIGAIAVSSGTAVRMRMKNSSKLFETRDFLSLLLLRNVRRYTKVGLEALLQILDATTYDLNTSVVLLDRLVTAVDEQNVGEAQIILRLLQQLITTEESQMERVTQVLGVPGAPLAEILRNAALRPPESHSSRDGDGGDEHSQLTVQVIGWCKENSAAWRGASGHIRRAVRNVERPKGRKERDRTSAKAKATRLHLERRQQSDTKRQQELKRIRAERKAELGDDKMMMESVE